MMVIIKFSQLNHAKLIMPVLFCQVVLLSPGGKRLLCLGFPYSCVSPFPCFPSDSGCQLSSLWLQSVGLCLRAGGVFLQQEVTG